MPNSILLFLGLIVLGLLPSLIWLLYYLRKDLHPEPKKNIIKAFIGGMAIAPLAAALELIVLFLINAAIAMETASKLLILFMSTALIEEYLKYWSVKINIFQNPEFDEPIDAMIYLIIAALGFAAVENVLVVFRVAPDGVTSTLGVTLLRFVGATLLHTLASGIIGYYLALSWFIRRQKEKLVIRGLILATIFHAIFNFLLVSKSRLSGILIALLLVLMSALVSRFFLNLKARSVLAMQQENSSGNKIRLASKILKI